MSGGTISALDANFIRDLYKEVKDNRTLKGEFLRYLEEKISRGEGCGVEEFMEAVSPNEALVIRFYRKVDKVHPKRFSHNDLLYMDMRQGLRPINRSLRDFLLWNQGVPPSFSTPLVISRITSGPMAKVASVPPLPVPVPLVATHTSVVASPASVALPSVARMTSSGTRNLASTPPSLMQPAKIEPIPLWRNSSLPTPVVKGTINKSAMTPASVQLSSAVSASSDGNIFPNVSSACLSASSLQNSSKKRTTQTHGEQSRKITVRMPVEIVDLLDDDEEIQQLGSAFQINDMHVPLSPVASLPSTSKSKKLSKSHVATTGSIPSGSHPKEQLLNHGQRQQAFNGLSAAGGSADQPGLTLARSLAQRFCVDLNFVEKTLKEAGSDINWAMRKIQQYQVDIEEARLMDQARLHSEDTAVQDKARAVQEREIILSTSKALQEFASSELLKHTAKMHHVLSKPMNSLDGELEKTLRSSCIELLEQEAKAIKWYSDSARAYMRSRAKDLAGDFSALRVKQELDQVKIILYSTASENGTPLPFLAALDAETTSAIQPGVVLGLSSENPVELT